MASVTQTIPNYLGGVSRQADVKKSPGQVNTCLNAYPDPTYGLCKRPGLKWLQEVGNTSEYLNSEWFYIHRDSDEVYIGCITSTPQIKVWNVRTGVACTVTQPNTSYLAPVGTSTTNTPITSTTRNRYYHVLTVQDTTIITNRTKVVTKLADPSFTPGLNASIQVKSIQYEVTYRVKINSQQFTYQTRASSTASTQGALTVDEVLTALKAGIVALNITGLTVTQLDGSLELVCTSPMTVTVGGGVGDMSIVALYDAVNSIADLPNQSVQGRVFKVMNTTSPEDDYWVKFSSTFGTSGSGVWEETKAPNASAGIDAATMPHQLVNTAPNTFEFKPITWEARLVGNDVTNSMPSFVNNQIQFSLFAANRLGFLSENNLIMSQAGDYYNFFNKSSRIQVDSDPIDASAGDNKPTLLFSALQITQGILLFSENAQFLILIQDNGLSPTNAIIKKISNYQVDTQVFPLDSGTEVVYLSKTLTYTRVFKMLPQGNDNTPQLAEISRIVMEWIPGDIDEMMVSPDNSFVGLSSRNANTAYFYRTYNNGEKDLMQSWYSWELPGNILFMEVDGDVMLFVTSQNGKVSISFTDINQSNSASLETISGYRPEFSNPALDLIASPKSVSYSSALEKTTVELPYVDVPTLAPIIMIVGDATTNADVGMVFTPTRKDSTHWEVVGINLATVSGKVIIGFTYNMEVLLPTTYFKKDSGYDYTSTLTIARYKFFLGLSGSMRFLIQAKGSELWNDVKSPLDADYYRANDAPLNNEMIVEIPIHQKNNNFVFKVQSESPYLTTLTSMTWEGRYSPRYYRRIA